MTTSKSKCSRCGGALHPECDGEVAEGMCQSCMWDEECEMMEHSWEEAGLVKETTR